MKIYTQTENLANQIKYIATLITKDNHFIDNISVGKELSYTNFYYINSIQEYKQKDRILRCDSITEHVNKKIQIYTFIEVNQTDTTKSRLKNFIMIVPFHLNQNGVLKPVPIIRYEAIFEVADENNDIKHHGNINNFGDYASSWYQKTNNSSSTPGDSNYAEFRAIIN